MRGRAIWSRSNAPRGKELEFLPAALEIQETPPSPLGLAVGGLVIVVFAAAVLWASVGRVDTVAVARGKIIPADQSSDHSKIVQPLEAGIIRTIRVREGQAVRQGDVLVELDATASHADLQRLSSEHANARVEVGRLRALLAGRESLEAPRGADPRFVLLQEQLLRRQLAEHRGRLESARSLVEQRQAALQAARANAERLEATLPLLTERTEAYRKLSEEGYVARMQYLEFEEKRIDKAQELVAQKHKLVQDAAALAEAEEASRVIEAEFRRARLGELSELETRIASQREEIVKASQRLAIQKLTAPIDGVVQQLAVHTVGGVVTPAQQLLVIVPRESRLEVESWVENKDIGFVRPEQSVEVKVETFPFTLYGTVRGKVLSVSRDAVQQEKVGLVYATRVSLERSTVLVDGAPVALLPGMAATVEIRTGERRLIEFFLSPLLRYRQESLRER